MTILNFNSVNIGSKSTYINKSQCNVCPLYTPDYYSSDYEETLVGCSAHARGGSWPKIYIYLYLFYFM